MELDIGINPNCSEATVRVHIDGQKKRDVNALEKKLEFELNNDYDPDKVGEWDEEKKKYEFDLSEGYINRENIFGVNVLKISGDAPYNHSEDIMTIVRRYLPYAEIQWSE
jgi:hypothetical protein